MKQIARFREHSRHACWLATMAGVLILSPAAPGAEPNSPGEAYTQVIPAVDISFDMVHIPGGKFQMGSPAGEEGRADGEGPQLEVEIEPFWMAKYEAIWDDYAKFRAEYDVGHEPVPFNPTDAGWLDAVSVPTPLWEQDSRPILEGMGEQGGFPVANISNFAARQYTKWLSKMTGHFYRLPTEAEWEYAARAGTTTPFSFGSADGLEDHAWFYDNSLYDDDAKGHPEFGAGYRKVGTRKPNPWGLYDMHGNVSEWVIDAYDPNHYQQFAGKSLLWKDVIAWPTVIFPRVARGGNWNSEAEECRSAARLASNAAWQKRDPQIPKSIWWYTDSFHVGFRVVRPLKQPSAEEMRKFWEADTETEALVMEVNDKLLRIALEKDDEAKP